MIEVLLRLYVAGDTPRSQRARRNLQALCAHVGGVRVDVVDVVDDPQAAESARVLTTPTLVREGAAPARRVVGDLSDVPRVLDALGLAPAPAPAPPPTISDPS